MLFGEPQGGFTVSRLDGRKTIAFQVCLNQGGGVGIVFNNQHRAVTVMIHHRKSLFVIVETKQKWPPMLQVITPQPVSTLQE
jgi:hypothetical protein